MSLGFMLTQSMRDFMDNAEFQIVLAFDERNCHCFRILEKYF